MMQAKGIRPAKAARWFLAAALLLSSGCAFTEPLDSPEVVAGSASTVTFRAGSLRGTESAARNYCANYNRLPELKTYTSLTGSAKSLYIYDCVDQVSQ